MRSTVLLVVSLGFGCGDNLAAEAPDASLPDAPPAFVEAPFGNAPQVISGGGPVLAAGKVQPIFFAGDGDVQPQVEQFLNQLGASSYWSATTAEYGVGPITNLPTIVSSDPVPATDQALQTWLAAQLDGTHAGWPAVPDPNTVYTVFIPAGVSFEGACTSYGAYHDEDSAQGVAFPYALIPRCMGSSSVLDTLTVSLSHELVEAATDPLPFSAPAFVRLDPEHFVWGRTPGGELGDMCEYLQNVEQPLVGSFVVQRTWSNASAAAGHDPCVPVMATPYASAVPVLDEDLMVTSHGQPIMTKGITVPLNMSKTIAVQLFSDAPTAEWSVAAYDAAALLGGQGTLAFQWGKTTGKNGDKLQVIVTRTRTAGNRGSEMVIVSKVDNKIVAMWWGYVAQ
jgi:hypothetical protein